MRAFRLSLKRHQRTAFAGEGARLAGGRWNHRGTRLVYCSETRALAAMEFFVNLDPRVSPPELALIEVEIPDELIRVVRVSGLPSNWRDYPAPDALQRLGTEWVRKGSSVAMKVPSALVPEEWNVLLNPAHPDFRQIRIGRAAPFLFDPRLRKA